MKSIGRVFIYPDASSFQRRETTSSEVVHKRYKPRPLSSIPTRELWELRDEMDLQIRNGRDKKARVLKGLKKRRLDLDAEIDERILMDEKMCEEWGWGWQDSQLRYVLHPGSTIENPTWIATEVWDFWSEEKDPSRRSQGKIPWSYHTGFDKGDRVPNPKNKIRYVRPQRKG